jgi:1-aminocyclopropane-1-carboxylate deaminase
MLTYTPTPIQEIHDPVFDQAGVRVLIKREDLNHPFVSGNKWWKLKYNLQEAKRLNHKTLLTFGGAYSNHIYATAAAAGELGFQSIGVIRGEETLPLNRKKTNVDFIESLRDRFGDFYQIPEGGTNEFAVKGVTEFAQSLGDDFDYVSCAVGTGGTLAGLINGLPENKTLLGFSSLKGGSFLESEIECWINTRTHKNFQIITDYHFGGYGKTTAALNLSIDQFYKKFNMLLDPVYTSKMVFGVFDLIQKNFFPLGTTILIVHTGGLQGIYHPNKS